MRPSPILCRRVKTRHAFTTKEVAKGYYRGSGTGSMGAHTRWGGYLIDWRKTRHFVVPNLEKCHLTPFVPAQYDSRLDPAQERAQRIMRGGRHFLRVLKDQNPKLWNFYLDEEAKEETARVEKFIERARQSGAPEHEVMAAMERLQAGTATSKPIMAPPEETR